MYPFPNNRLLALLIAGGLVLFGSLQFVYSHGSEYLFAKLTLSENPRKIVLEISVEYLDNPLIDSKQGGREVLASQILIESAQGMVSFADLGKKVSWSERDEFDDSSPAPSPDSEDGIEHKLLVASADLSEFDAEFLNLRIAEEAGQAVIFWVDEPKRSDAEAGEKPLRWVMLIAGDRSMAVDLPRKY